jgi:tetratricopeptide (TPR) repeat protein
MRSRNLKNLFTSDRIHEAEPHEQIAFYELVIVVARTQGENELEAAFGLNLGMAYLDENRHEEALDRLSNSSMIFESLGNASRQAETLDNLGIVCSNMGDFEHAQQYYLRALETSIKLKSTELISSVSRNLTIMLAREQETARDRPAAEYIELEQRATEYGLTELASAANAILGRASTERSNGKLAISTIDVVNEPPMGELNDLAINCLVSNQSLRAIKIFQHMLQYAELHGDMTNMSHLLYSIGDAYREIGLWQDASEFFARALAAFEAADLKGMEARTAQYLAISYRELGDLKAAAMYAERSAEIGATEGKTTWEVDARATLASILFAADQYGQAQAELARCLNILGSVPASSEDPLEYDSHVRQLLRGIAERLSTSASSQMLDYLQAHSFSRNANDRDDLAASLRHEIPNLVRILHEYHSSGSQELEMQTARDLAVIQRDVGEFEAAEAYAEQSLTIGISTGSVIGEIGARATLATVLFAANKTSRGYAELGRCLSLLGSAASARAENWHVHVDGEDLRTLAYVWAAPLSGEERWGWDWKDAS